jgi:dUTP pyrophosphatase
VTEDRYKCQVCQAYRAPDRTGTAARCAACGAWIGSVPRAETDDMDAYAPGAPHPQRRDVLQVKALDTRALAPRYAHEFDAGLDLYALEPMDIMPTDGIVRVPLGLAVALPTWCEGQVRGRSGLTSRGLIVHLGTLDAGYCGELSALVEARQWVRVPYGQAIAQLVVAPVARCDVRLVEELPRRDARGYGGFGSTDVMAHDAESW